MTIDTQAFRSALGDFPTGVTVVTTTDEQGDPVGVTASSFNSVSLEPPLVLWSLSCSALSHDAFRASGHFAIHVLAADQEDVSDRFARSGGDKFADTWWEPGTLGSPVLDHYAALFECRTLHQHEGGDHVILVGEVVAFERKSLPPLVFHGGRYAETRERRGEGGDAGPFRDDTLFRLLARAYHRSVRPTRDKLRAIGMSGAEYLVLARVSEEGTARSDAIVEALRQAGQTLEEHLLGDMIRRDLIAQNASGAYYPTETGRALLMDAIAVGKAAESEVASCLGTADLAEAERLLRRIVQACDAD